MAVRRLPEPVWPFRLARGWRARSFQRMRRVVVALWGPLTLTWAVTRPVLVFQVAVPSTTVSATKRTLWRSSLTLASITAWIGETRVPNVRPPLRLDVTAEAWPVEVVQAMCSANLIHIAPLDDLTNWLEDKLGPVK